MMKESAGLLWLEGRLVAAVWVALATAAQDREERQVENFTAGVQSAPGRQAGITAYSSGDALHVKGVCAGDFTNGRKPMLQGEDTNCTAATLEVNVTARRGNEDSMPQERTRKLSGKTAEPSALPRSILRAVLIPATGGVANAANTCVTHNESTCARGRLGDVSGAAPTGVGRSQNRQWLHGGAGDSEALPAAIGAHARRRPVSPWAVNPRNALRA